MSVPDELIVKYYRLASTESVDKIDEIEAAWPQVSSDPNKTKRAPPATSWPPTTTMWVAEKPKPNSTAHRRASGPREDVPEFAADLTPNEEGTVYLARILQQAGMVQTVSEGRRKIDEGGVYINGETVGKGAYNVDPRPLASRTDPAGQAQIRQTRVLLNSAHVGKYGVGYRRLLFSMREPQDIVYKI